MMPNPKRLEALAQAYDDQVHAVRARLEAFGQAYWESMPNYRDAALEGMLNALIPRVKAGQIKTAELTRAYLQAFAEESGWAGHTPPVDIEEVTSQRGVDPKVVYSRPIVIVRAALGEGKSLEEAAKAGGLRLLQLIGGDMQLAKRSQARRSMEATGVEAYRRKLTGRENCALCVIASTQRYWVKDLLPIHPGCDCNVEPLPPHLAGEHVIDEETLEAAHAAVEQELGVSARNGRDIDYRELILTTEHGEYGPVISWKETRAERRVRANKWKNDITSHPAGHLDEYKDATLMDIYRGVVSKRAMRAGIRPYPTLADVPRMSAESVQDAILKINPLWGKTLTESQAQKLGLERQAYNVNCVRCSIALEMRLRGYDLVAGAGRYLPPITWANAVTSAWKNSEGRSPHWRHSKTMTELIADIEKREPNGARGFVRLEWKSAHPSIPRQGHVFNWVKEDGEVHFYDAQIVSSLEDEEKTLPRSHQHYIDKAYEGSMKYIRIDDCEPKDLVLTQISKVVN